MIDVVLTDDHPVVRAGLRAVIENEPDMRVVAELATAEELVAHVRDGGRGAADNEGGEDEGAAHDNRSHLMRVLGAGARGATTGVPVLLDSGMRPHTPVNSG